MPKYIFGSGYLIIWLLVSRYWVLPLGFLWPSLVRAETSLRLRQLDQFPAHTSHRMHCISGGALQCNEHVLHCVALFFSEPESSSSLCSWLCCSRFQCNESPTLHSPPHAPSSYIAAGFWTLVCTGGADCTGAVHYCIGAGSQVLNSCMHWCSALLCSHLECSTLPPDCRSFMHLAALPCLSAPHVVTIMLFRQIALKFF